MDIELKQQWVAALRSGEYRQIRAQLRSHSDGYCCLGVLCDIVDPDGWVKDEVGGWVWVDNDGTLDERHNRSSKYLPLTLEDRLFEYGRMLDTGIARSDGRELRVEVGRAGAVLNDEGWTFEQIADFIETRL